MMNRITSILSDKTCQRQIRKSGLADSIDFDALEKQTDEASSSGKPPVILSREDINRQFPSRSGGIGAAPGTVETNYDPGAHLISAQEEAVVLLKGRPALLIRQNRIQIPADGLWAQPILSSRTLIEANLPSIGRIEIDEGFGSRAMGTGWLVAEGIIATNRHVAEIFAIKKDRGGAFKVNFLQQPYRANIDFLEEFQERDEFEIAISDVIFMEGPDRTKPDIAFLKLRSHGSLPAPLPVSEEEIPLESDLAVIGYPAYDPRYGLDALEAAKAIFGNIYDVKRLSPGKYKESRSQDWYFAHDATTLGGNSGSPVIHLTTGLVIGMHFSGDFRTMNYAVKMSEISRQAKQSSLKLYVPSWTPAPALRQLSAEKPVEEIPVADYEDRKGYSPSFLGPDDKVNAPKITAALKADLLTRPGNGNTPESVLKYTHFSVEMNKNRRMCFYSAVNIDGKKSVSIKGRRPGWRFDPRIPAGMQILNECYGLESEGKFSRGHMTRREDPNWGPAAQATAANADTFHVTNACPQMQPFNAGIWNGLEDYALQNARQDDMKISVFTGPVFSDDDPVIQQVKIPVRFWKVIAFIHDQTGKLTATGYMMSQKAFLPGEEFVYGQFETYQVSLKQIEAETRLSFGTLTARDAMKATEESVPVPLREFEQIRFDPAVAETL